MSRPSIADKSISRQRLLQMLSRRRPEPQDGPSDGADAPLFDWTCPHHFGPQEWLLMKNLGKKIAAYMEKAMELVCLEEPKVTLNKVVQEFASVMAERTLRQEATQYFLPLQVQAKGPDGFVNVQIEAATVLVGQLLRDNEAVIGQNGELSVLEETILQDGILILADAIIQAIQEYGEITVKRSDRLVRGDWPLDARQLEDLVGFSFDVAFPKKTVEIVVQMQAESLDPAVGIMPRIHKAVNPAELSKMIIRQLSDVPVEVTAQLCTGSVRMEELMHLEVGDVLVLGKKIQEPADVLLNNRLCFQAWPAACEGKQALVIANIKK
ncbi:FliM/FliN family flagellar motor switch protein [Anaerohalosphaeraceae bacterium U12dextr]|jgi:flagellar motor switch/type III secretory pathway protein FliN